MAMLHGCDTFVVLPPFTENGFVIFGKNSDRPSAEVQEVVYVAGQQHPKGGRLSCTYIDVDQVERTHAVVLSKPSWMWGAEMGANECGVVVGNEAVWTRLRPDEAAVERLLGMDLLRLGLERARTAQECVQVIGELLEKYGQGGPCSEDINMSYHNSFLIVDRREAWIMETADRLWVACKVEGFGNISNNLTIEANYSMKSNNLEEVAAESGLWQKEDGPLSFRKVFSSNGDCLDPRQVNGRKMLEKYTADRLFNAGRMMDVLRDERSGICMSLGGSFVSTSSQVSILPTDPSMDCVHFFTGTPDPLCSGFKPFVFSAEKVQPSPLLVSPVYSDDPAKRKPRFQSKVDRRHALYKAHEAIMANDQKREKAVQSLRTVERSALNEIVKCLCNGGRIADASSLFKDAVEAEMRIFHNA